MLVVIDTIRADAVSAYGSVDLAPHRLELVDRFTRELEGFVQAAGVLEEASGEEPSPEAIEALRALGYIDG
jgi:hypothetical protein